MWSGTVISTGALYPTFTKADIYLRIPGDLKRVDEESLHRRSAVRPASENHDGDRPGCRAP